MKKIIKSLRSVGYSVNETENHIQVILKEPRHYKGCDYCKKSGATEQFRGLTGNILWFCDDCITSLIISSEDPRSILREVRIILETPEGEDIRDHARNVLEISKIR